MRTCISYRITEVWSDGTSGARTPAENDRHEIIHVDDTIGVRVRVSMRRTPRNDDRRDVVGVYRIVAGDVVVAQAAG